MSRETLIAYLDNFYRHGSDTAYAQRRGYRWVRWSYRQVAEAACALARELEARGIGRGDRVIIWGENSAEWVVAFLGCLLRGAVAVPMDEIASDDFALRVGRQVDARLLFCSRRHEGLDSSLTTLPLDDLPAVLARHSGQRYSPPQLRPEETVEIVFTSGTTAEPKGVVISNRNILANLQPLETEIDKYIRYERLVHPVRFLNLLPLSHVFGQFLGIFVPQLLGGAVIFQDSLNPAEIIRTARHERVSVVVAVPRLLESLRDKVERDLEAAGRLERFRKQLSAAEGKHFLKRWWWFRQIHGRFGWKFWAFVCGGAALNPEVETFWSRLGFLVIQGYGLTETTSLISLNHPLRPGKGSIGKVLPGREVKLDENGEILVRGEGIASGYWRGRELAPVAGEEGWFRTGDIGALDEQGNLYFKGRKKNVIVTAEGMNVYPEDLEAELRRQPEVRDCVVMALAREGNAEPYAVLILRDGSENVEAIIRRANKSLASYQQIRRWFVWPEEDFPRTSTQKIRTSAIQEVIGARAGGEGSEAASGGTLAGLVARITGRPQGALSPDARLAEDLNLSSIDRVELLSAVEDRFQADVSDVDFTAATTVGDLERMLREPALRRVDYDYATWPQRWPATWIRLLVYYLMVWPATRLLAWPRIRGRQHLRGVEGPVLVVCNHITAADIGFVLAALPPGLRGRLATAMEGEILRAMQYPPAEMGLLRRWMERLSYLLVLGLFNVFPLPKQSGFRESFGFAGDLVDRGYSVLVFPEGMRTRDGTMAPFQAGIGLLANNLNIPVVPVRIDGLFELKKAHRHMAPPGAVTVSLGAPVQFQPGTAPEEIARRLQERVRELEYAPGGKPA